MFAATPLARMGLLIVNLVDAAHTVGSVRIKRA
jgi:hypothetical protein